ncbi:HEPN domain-containing protein [uncultured Cohaesibacter sp.]|uniref:HEPN domain-containing protein n=1 Tax=uncultured Cohaesibacter sp. TaxID=1002546 RepID=UPI0029C932C7|nr:HEPN domain-containing protein [uncultured Cohaesibacter sp.]
MKSGVLGLPVVSVNKVVCLDHCYESRIFSEFIGQAKSHEKAREKRAELENDERIKDLEKKMLSNGNGGTIFQLDRLIAWWLWRANNVGLEEADTDLESYLNSKKNSFQEILWVYGVEPTETIEIFSDARILPVEHMPPSGEVECILNNRMRSSPNKDLLFYAAIVADRFQEKFYSTEAICKTTACDYTGRLHDLALLMNVLPGVCCIDGQSSAYIPDNIPYGPLSGRGGGAAVYDVLPQLQTSKIGPECADELKKLVHGFGKLSSSWNERISRSIRRLAQAKSRVDLNDQALDLGIALEMVLLHSENNKNELPGQLHNHFRLRGAWLMGKSFEDRLKCYKMLGKIYSQRSQVAHNGVLSSPNSIKYIQLSEEIKEHIALAERILFKLIVEGPPKDWTSLVLDNPTAAIDETLQAACQLNE